MKKIKKYKFLIFGSSLLGMVAVLAPILSSCGTNQQVTNNETSTSQTNSDTNQLEIYDENTPYIVDQDLKAAFKKWYKNLSNDKWFKDKNYNYINYFCKSEQQAIGLYAVGWGMFWNEGLHAGKVNLPNCNFFESTLDSNAPHLIRGNDYKLVEKALDKAIYPWDDVVWHGCEYMETEFYDQLKPYINFDANTNSYDYTRCVGKTITSNGFISTSISKESALNYLGWLPGVNNFGAPEWHTNITNPHPLKSPVAFKIHIPAKYRGAAYLADFDWANMGPNYDNQVLINRHCQFTITKVWKENGVTFFDVNLIKNDLKDEHHYNSCNCHNHEHCNYHCNNISHKHHD
ncbi:ADP-ribosyltransferase [Mycoplasmoides alvi]|uniref:ADP-ribosyltransferase n=1 Tax=Mycoplasmoides alvi TaxID=78580 RepID=UPI000B268D4C|nr:ADP-ribosyltransferase [Mycoplasmoides alvi]